VWGVIRGWAKKSVSWGGGGWVAGRGCRKRKVRGGRLRVCERSCVDGLKEKSLLTTGGKAEKKRGD